MKYNISLIFAAAVPSKKKKKKRILEKSSPIFDRPAFEVDELIIAKHVHLSPIAHSPNARHEGHAPPSIPSAG